MTPPDFLVEIPDLPALARDLWRQVPRGRVTTFGDLGDALGDRVAARWLGHLALHHEHARGCPCHRLVRADGGLGGYVGGDVGTKALLLVDEGVAVVNAAIDLDRHGFAAFTSDRPLEGLRRLQDELRSRVKLTVRRSLPELVGGVDVSYAGESEGVAAYALVERASGRLVWSTSVRLPVTFPYISSFLSFRELPLLVELVGRVRAAGKLAEVVLVDGTGILHPRRFGIASHLGIAAGVPTVGVTKKLLCGSVQGGLVLHEGEAIATAILPTPTTRHPLYVSPGQDVDVAFARRVVEATLHGHRLPEPLYWADRLSRREAQG